MTQEYLFIAGAPRSGTTFLMNQLGQHFDITPSKEGASYYFMDEDHPLVNKKNNYHKDGLNGYDKVFKDSKGRFFLDGTDHLMYQLSMIEVIKKIQKKKIIFIFREPAQRIYSSFNYTKNNLGNFKKNISFKEYVDALLNNDKKQIKKWLVSDKRSGFILANELEYSYYHNYIEKWINEVGREHMVFSLFDDMLEDESLFMNNILNQLSLSKFEFENSGNNESYKIKNKFLHRQIMNASTFFPSSSLKGKIKDFYLRFQKDEINKNDKDIYVLEELKKEFLESNKEFHEITNLDISRWK